MPLTLDNVRQLAQLARIELTPADAGRAQAQLNDIFTLVEQLQAVNTTDVAPLAHPLDITQAMELRLRDDVITETDQRAANMANAPQQENGLFLVPKVIE